MTDGLLSQAQQAAPMAAREWITLAQIAVTVFMAWIGWSVRTIKRCIQKDIIALQERVTKNEAALEAKCSREDFIRATANTQRVLEKLLEGQGELKGKSDAGARIAAAIEKLAETREASR